MAGRPSKMGVIQIVTGRRGALSESLEASQSEPRHPCDVELSHLAHVTSQALQSLNFRGFRTRTCILLSGEDESAQPVVHRGRGDGHGVVAVLQRSLCDGIGTSMTI